MSKVRKNLQYRFTNEAMEREYSSIKALAIPRDFLVNIIFVP